MITTYIKYFMASLTLTPQSSSRSTTIRQGVGDKYTIVLNKCRLDVRKNFYSQRIVKDWNSLPANMVEAKDVITFEKLFDRIHGGYKFEFELN